MVTVFSLKMSWSQVVQYWNAFFCTTQDNQEKATFGGTLAPPSGQLLQFVRGSNATRYTWYKIKCYVNIVICKWFPTPLFDRFLFQFSSKSGFNSIRICLVSLVQVRTGVFWKFCCISFEICMFVQIVCLYIILYTYKRHKSVRAEWLHHFLGIIDRLAQT